MKLIILCLCLASTAYAAPFQYLPHYAGPRQQGSQIPFTPGFSHPAVPGAYSLELIYPYGFPGGAAGSNPEQPFSTYGLIKYSIPQPPGRQSVEVFYTYDFARQAIVPNMPPMTKGPVMPDLLPFHPQNIPQLNMNMPTFDTNAIPSQNPMQPLQQDQPTQTSQMPAKL